MLSSLPLPPWHKATDVVRSVAKQAAEYCISKNTTIEKLAPQFSIEHSGFASCLVGSARSAEISQLAQWVLEPLDQELDRQVQTILKPIHNWYYIEGRPENNDLECPTSVTP